jgi:hypothetical protein
MGLLRGAVKAAIAAKILDIARREMSKPANQQKVKELVGRLASRAKAARH